MYHFINYEMQTFQQLFNPKMNFIFHLAKAIHFIDST